jgi:hypothetical protein
MDCSSAVEVCKLIVAREAEFNNVNVVTALRTVQQSRRDGVPRQLVEQALHALEAAALRTIDAFEAREVASTLHIMAKTHYRPGDPSLVPALEGRAESLAGTFKAQDVANTLWAYAKMERRPGAVLMRVLEGQAEAVVDMFNAQEVANTLWAYATMGREPGPGLMRELEGRAEALAGTFIAQGVANTLWAYATMGREPGAGLMRELEGRAEALAGTFIAQGVANTLWAYATMGREPGAGLMRELEGRAEALAGTFIAQDVANMLWAYATMGWEPGAGLMRELEGRTEALAGTFNAQNVANTLWSACVFAILRSPAGGSRWFHSVSQRLVALGRPACFTAAELCQLHQFFVWCSVEPRLGVEAFNDMRTLQEKCRSAFVGAHTAPSATQQQVSEALRLMGLSVKDEDRCPKSGYSIDMIIHDSTLGIGGERSSGRGAWVLEFDGPSHFLASRTPTGATLLKRRHLQLLGHALVSVPYWEWDECKEAGEREQYLRSKLGACGPSAGPDRADKPPVL